MGAGRVVLVLLGAVAALLGVCLAGPAVADDERISLYRWYVTLSDCDRGEDWADEVVEEVLPGASGHRTRRVPP